MMKTAFVCFSLLLGLAAASVSVVALRIATSVIDGSLR